MPVASSSPRESYPGSRQEATSDEYDLGRFIDAQVGSYATALAEIRRGAKRSHWMWFVFPQIVGLGSSPTAQHFAIRSIEEAQAYLAHPMLGTRYRECVSALQDLDGGTALTIFGPVDAVKLRSSLTLFSEVGAGSLIDAALDRWFDGKDELTLEMLRQQVEQTDLME